MKRLNEYSFSEFRSRILSTAKTNENWYFSQSPNCWFADYKPCYPEKSAADFTVVCDHSSPRPRLTLYQDTATLPTIKQYSTFGAFITDLRNMEV